MKKSIKNAIKNAPKYVLHMEGNGYLAEEQKLTGVNFTHDINLARKFAHGFDNPDDKIDIWNAAVKVTFNIQLPGLFNFFEAVDLEVALAINAIANISK